MKLTIAILTVPIKPLFFILNANHYKFDAPLDSFLMKIWYSVGEICLTESQFAHSKSASNNIYGVFNPIEEFFLVAWVELELNETFLLWRKPFLS